VGVFLWIYQLRAEQLAGRPPAAFPVKFADFACIPSKATRSKLHEYVDASTSARGAPEALRSFIAHSVPLVPHIGPSLFIAITQNGIAAPPMPAASTSLSSKERNRQVMVAAAVAALRAYGGGAAAGAAASAAAESASALHVPKYLNRCIAAVVQLISTQSTTPLLANVEEHEVVPWLESLQAAATSTGGAYPPLSHLFLCALRSRLPQVANVVLDSGTGHCLPTALAPLVHDLASHALTAWRSLVKPAALSAMTQTVTLTENQMLVRGYSIPSSPRVVDNPHVFPGGGADDRECRSASSGKARGAAHMHAAPASKSRTSCIINGCCSCGVILALCFERNPESKRRLAELLLANFVKAKTVLFDHGCGLYQYLFRRYPWIFIKLLVLIDRMHAVNHGLPWSNCPMTHLMSSYTATDIACLSGAVSEHVNSRMAPALKSVMFSSGPLAMWILALYQGYHNITINLKCGQPAAVLAVVLGAVAEVEDSRFADVGDDGADASADDAESDSDALSLDTVDGAQVAAALDDDEEVELDGEGEPAEDMEADIAGVLEALKAVVAERPLAAASAHTEVAGSLEQAT